MTVLGSRVRHYREAAGIGVRELARRLQRSPGYITQLEQGRLWADRLPPTDDLILLASALAVTVADLLQPFNEEQQHAITTDPASTSHPEKTKDEKTAFLEEQLRLIQYSYQTNFNQLARERDRLMTQMEGALSLGGHKVIPVRNAADNPNPRVLRTKDSITVPTLLLREAKRPTAFKVWDDSLATIGIKSGDYILFDTAPAITARPMNGSMVLARHNSADIIRVAYRAGAGAYRLIPIPPDTSIEITVGVETHINGVAVGLWTPERPMLFFQLIPKPSFEKGSDTNAMTHDVQLDELGVDEDAIQTEYYIPALGLWRIDQDYDTITRADTRRFIFDDTDVPLLTPITPDEQRLIDALAFFALINLPTHQASEGLGTTSILNELQIPAELVEKAREPYGVFVFDDAMAEYDIVAGDILLIDRSQCVPKIGQIVALRRHGTTIVRRVMSEGDKQTLQPGPLSPTDAESVPFDKLDILGRVVVQLKTGNRL